MSGGRLALVAGAIVAVVVAGLVVRPHSPDDLAAAGDLDAAAAAWAARVDGPDRARALARLAEIHLDRMDLDGVRAAVGAVPRDAPPWVRKRAAALDVRPAEVGPGAVVRTGGPIGLRVEEPVGTVRLGPLALSVAREGREVTVRCAASGVEGTVGAGSGEVVVAQVVVEEERRAVRCTATVDGERLPGFTGAAPGMTVPDEADVSGAASRITAIGYRG